MPRAAFTSVAALRWAVSHEVSGQHWWKIWLSVCHHWEDRNYSSTWRVGALKKKKSQNPSHNSSRQGDGANSMFTLLTVKDAGVCHFLSRLRHDNAPTIFFLKRETPRPCSLLPEGWRTFRAAHRLATASVQMPSSNTKNRRIINDVN